MFLRDIDPMLLASGILGEEDDAGTELTSFDPEEEDEELGAVGDDVDDDDDEEEGDDAY